MPSTAKPDMPEGMSYENPKDFRHFQKTVWAQLKEIRKVHENLKTECKQNSEHYAVEIKKTEQLTETLY